MCIDFFSLGDRFSLLFWVRFNSKVISFYAIRFILIFTVVCSLVDLGSGDWKRIEHHYYANSIDQTSRTLDVITIAKYEYAGISERPDPMFGISVLMASLIGMSFEIYVLVICIVLSACLVACIGRSYSNRSGALRSWVWFGISLVVLSCHSPLPQLIRHYGSGMGHSPTSRYLE